MNKYIITSLVECSLYFNNVEPAQDFANEHGLNVCQVYYLDEHTPVFMGYGIENENGLCNGNEFVWV
jgi:hypothetical protein